METSAGHHVLSTGPSTSCRNAGGRPPDVLTQMLQIQKFRYTQLCKVLSEINNNFDEIEIWTLFPNTEFSIKLQVDFDGSLFRSE